MELSKASKSSLQAVGELLSGAIQAAGHDTEKRDLADLVEHVRNAYTDLLWEVYMSQFAQGDRQVLDGILQRQRYTFEEAKPGVITIDNIQVANLPRDAGVYQVIPFGQALKDAKPYTKSTAAQSHMTSARINPGVRYYRVDEGLYFPDGHPDGAQGVDVLFYGLGTDDTVTFIPRDFANKVYVRVWQVLFPSVQVPADVTNNANPNE